MDKKPDTSEREPTLADLEDRLDEFLPKRATMRTLTLNVPEDLWRKLKALARFRDLPMSHVVSVAAKPLVDKLYWEMENDYRAAMRGEKRKP